MKTSPSKTMVAHVSEAENHGSVYEQSDDVDSDEEPLGICVPEYTLKVFSPKKIFTDRGGYTSYGISLETRSPAFRLQRSKTRRRFSDFVWLRKELDKTDNWRSPPVLSAKRFWNLFDPKFVESRRRQLQLWIHDVLSEPCYLSNVALHLFLQTEMTIEQIQDYLSGKISEQRMEEIWSNHGKLYHYQAYNLLHNNFRQQPMEIHYTAETDTSNAPNPSPTQLAVNHHSPPPHLATETAPKHSEDRQSLEEFANDTDTDGGLQLAPDGPSAGDLAAETTLGASQRCVDRVSHEVLATEGDVAASQRSLDLVSDEVLATEGDVAASQRSVDRVSHEVLATERDVAASQRSVDRVSHEVLASERDVAASQRCSVDQPLPELPTTGRETFSSSSPSDDYVGGFRNMSPDSGYQDEQLIQVSSASLSTTTTTTTTTATTTKAKVKKVHFLPSPGINYSINGE